MNDFKAWLDTHAPQTLPQSPLGKAFRYTLNYWVGLCRFLDDGRLEVDNNINDL
jgi:transposase